eukprot:TRINITY_DN74458_c0_g1_i1.p1 TRINITY_DN74458_c0_g1~~TRINITY_DN74458_c0_g1_i1.p1  ORF type:complete len:263 (+),score=88.71 TRINITY_DN74458_c0_g1_i1:62-850(+)
MAAMDVCPLARRLHRSAVPEGGSRRSRQAVVAIGAVGACAYLLAAKMTFLAMPASNRLSSGSRPTSRLQGASLRDFSLVLRRAEGEDAEDGAEVSPGCKKLLEEIEELKAVNQEKQDAHDRLNLEVSNYRARTRKELAKARSNAAVPLLEGLFPFADEYELVVKNVKTETEGEQAICDRFDQLFKKSLGSWSKMGVTKMEAIGKDFDPEFHEAVTMIPSDEYKPDIVANELRCGWVLKAAGDDEAQVLRPALVCVSSGPGPA